MCIMSHQFSGVSNVATEVDVNLKDITALLDNEVEEEENFQVLEFKKNPHQLQSFKFDYSKNGILFIATLPVHVF